MIDLQKIIDELEAQKKSHKESALSFDKHSQHAAYRHGKSDECDFWIQKLTLLLNTGNEKHR
jgi:hypothetical protein